MGTRHLAFALLFVGTGVGCSGTVGGMIDPGEKPMEPAEPSAPAPGTLVGFIAEGGGVRLRAIDPLTGETTIRGGIITSMGLQQSQVDLDETTDMLYVMSTTFTSGVTSSTLHSIDAATGELLGSVVPERGSVVRTDGAGNVVGICVVDMVRSLCRTSPATGKSTVMRALPDIDATLFAGGVTVDRAAGRYYTVSKAKADGAARLFTIDINTGELLGTASLDVPVLHVNAQGKLIGARAANATLELYEVDPATASLRVITSIPGPQAAANAPSALDVRANRFYYIARDAVAGQQLYTLDATTGEPISVIAFAGNAVSLHIGK